MVGGGGPAAAKARLALKAGARVTMIAPSLGLEASQMAAAGEVIHRRRSFVAADIADHAVVFGAAVHDDVASEVAVASQAAGVPVNIVDHPHLSTFTMPAIIDRSPVVIGIATGGSAPALARQIRGQIEAVLPARLGRLAQFAASFRASVRAKIPGRLARLRFWQRMFSGPIAEAVLAGDDWGAQRQFLRFLNRTGADKAPAGKVFVVGAGPGDPDLLTVRALRLIQTADVIVYDRLVAPAVLEFARRDAERVYAGKQAGNHALSQDEINALMVQRAEAGLRVVRLKGGDPFVFGRGGEELDYLHGHGIDTEIVPGLTAALGCAAAAGIPLTQRGKASAVTLLTGQSADGRADHDWAALAKSGHTIVVYMGVSVAKATARDLIAHGMDPATPVAVIENGTLAEQRVLAGSLSELGDLVTTHRVQSPALIVIGEVARAAGAARGADERLRALAG